MPFIRNSSGLVKNASLADAMMLNIANMGAGLAIFTGISPYIVKGAVLWIASILTFLLSLPLVFLYTFFIIQIHRTGGDYVWLSRKLNGKIGSIMGIALGFNMPPFFALSAFFSIAAINTVLTVIGELNNQPGLVNLANTIFVNPYGTLSVSQEILIYVLAGIAFAIIIAINIFRPKWGFKIVTGLGILAILGTLAAMIVIGMNIGDFHSGIRPFLQDFNLTQYLSNSTNPSFSWRATLYMVPYFASFAYIWLYAGPAVSAEIKSDKGIKYNLILGSLLTLFLITVPFLLMDIAGGYGFNYSLYPTDTYNFWSVAIALARNEALQWFIGIALIAWEFFVMAFGVVVFARYVFAFSFDRLFPTVFARLNKNSSPVYAHLLDFAATLVFLAFPILLPTGYQALYSYTPLAIAYLLLVGIAGIRYAREIRNIPMLITAGISILFMIFMGYYAFTNPYFGVITDTGTPYIPGIAYIVGLIGLGAAIYVISKYVNLNRGIDIDLNYKEIPPE